MDREVEEMADNDSESKLHPPGHSAYLVIEDKLQVQRLLSICEPLIISRSGPPANVASSDTNIDEVFLIDMMKKNPGYWTQYRKSWHI